VSNSLIAAIAVLLVTTLPSPAQTPDATLLSGLTADFDRLAPQTIRPAEGYIRYPYLIPAGYYSQMWDWDGFFIGAHWANQDPEKASCCATGCWGLRHPRMPMAMLRGASRPLGRGPCSANLP